MLGVGRTKKIKNKSSAKKSEKTEIQHPVLGPITLLRSGRSRRISISVRPPAKIRLTVPFSISVREGLSFLESRLEWIEKTVKKQEQKFPEKLILPPFRTKFHDLSLEPSNNDTIKTKIGEGVIKISHPAYLRVDSPPVQEAIKKGVEEAWRVEARMLLPVRTKDLASRHGFSYGKVSVRNSRSRWGSCSVRNDISYSLNLMRLPDALIDYVILHELCHTVHKNHGPLFHQLMEECTGGRHQDLRNELRKYSARW